MRYAAKDPRIKTKLSPAEKVKQALLANRLKVTSPEAARLMFQLENDTSEILNLPRSAVTSDTEFASRNLDLIFTINKQNTPK